MIIQRRSFLIGLTSILAAPAIVRAESIMPVRALRHHYTGPVMRLRGPDNHEYDIVLTPDGWLDVDAIVRGGLYPPRIVTWYDQSGNNRHMPNLGHLVFCTTDADVVIKKATAQ